MKATAQMGGLTAEQVEAWAAILHGSCGSNEILRSAVEGLCDLALQALDRESVRSEALLTAEVACLNEMVDAVEGQEADYAYNRACRDCADAVRALSPARVAEGQCVYPEECKHFGRCIKTEDHDNPSVCKDVHDNELRK